jgi:hypothetical protein
LEKIPASTSLKTSFGGMKCFTKSINNLIITILKFNAP